MILASFDIGLKNFAFCIIDTSNCSILYLGNTDLSGTASVYHEMTRVLDQHSEYWERTSVILIEKQMSYKHKMNTLALRLSQHCLSYFLILYGSFKTILEYPSQKKTKILGATWEERSTKPNRKKFAIRRATEFLQTHPESLAVFLSHKKKDDLADVLCQAQAYCIENKINIL